MPTMICVRCDESFYDDRTRCYCDPCVEAYLGRREQVSDSTNPKPGVLVDGKFAKPLECPVTGYDEDNQQVCGLCGSREIEPGYGFSGYGCGAYVWCHDCGSFLDFCEDTGE